MECQGLLAEFGSVSGEFRGLERFDLGEDICRDSDEGLQGSVGARQNPGGDMRSGGGCRCSVGSRHRGYIYSGTIRRGSQVNTGGRNKM